MEDMAPRKQDTAYHFVAYVPHNGRVYELDGIKPAPIDHGAIVRTSVCMCTCVHVYMCAVLSSPQCVHLLYPCTWCRADWGRRRLDGPRERSAHRANRQVRKWFERVVRARVPRFFRFCFLLLGAVCLW